MANRNQLIEALDNIQGNIKTYERRLLEKKEGLLYEILGDNYYEHRRYIALRCLGFWQRKFNRTLEQLKYQSEYESTY